MLSPAPEAAAAAAVDLGAVHVGARRPLVARCEAAVHAVAVGPVVVAGGAVPVLPVRRVLARRRRRRRLPLQAFDQPLDRWDTSALTAMNSMFECADAFDQDLGWQVSADCTTSLAFFNTKCSHWDCGLNGATPPPTPKPTPVQTSGAAATAPLLFLGVAALLLSQ